MRSILRRNPSEVVVCRRRSVPPYRAPRREKNVRTRRPSEVGAVAGSHPGRADRSRLGTPVAAAGGSIRLGRAGDLSRERQSPGKTTTVARRRTLRGVVLGLALLVVLLSRHAAGRVRGMRS